MGYLHIPSGTALELELILADGNTGRFPQARVYVSGSNTEISGSPINLTHATGGRYLASLAAPVGRYTAVYRTYSSIAHTTQLFKYGQPTDSFEVDTALANISAIVNKTNQFTFTGGNVNINIPISQLNAIADSVWDELLSGHLSVGSTGEALNNAAAGSTTTLTAQDIINISDAVWDETASTHTTIGTMGALENIIANLATTANVNTATTTIQGDLTTATAAIIDATIDRDIWMTVAVEPVSDIAEFQVWLTEDGVTATDADSAFIDVREGDGTLVFTVGPQTVDANGVYKLTRATASAVLNSNQTYHVLLTVVRGLDTYTATKSFTVF